jgi:hypothetical protein
VDKLLLLFIDDSHLVNQELSCCLLVVLILKPCQSLVGLKQLSLVVLHDSLVLLPRSLKLKVVAVQLVLEVEVFLQELVPLSLAYVFTLLQLLNKSPSLYVFLTQILKQIGENGTLLFVVAAVADALHGQFHVLLQVVQVRLLQSECIGELSSLSLEDQVLAGKVLSFHLVEKPLRVKVLVVQLVDVLFE